MAKKMLNVFICLLISMTLLPQIVKADDYYESHTYDCTIIANAIGQSNNGATVAYKAWKGTDGNYYVAIGGITGNNKIDDAFIAKALDEVHNGKYLDVDFIWNGNSLIITQEGTELINGAPKLATNDSKSDVWVILIMSAQQFVDYRLNDNGEYSFPILNAGGFKIDIITIEKDLNEEILEDAAYSLTYDLCGGNGNFPKQSEINKDGYADFTVNTAIPTKTGYDFIGWATTAAATVANVGTTVHATETNKDITIYAIWSPHVHTVTYKVDGEQVLEKESYPYGATVTVRDKYVKENYEVTDWDITGSFSMPDEDVVITATSKPIEYTVTYLLNGNEYKKETYTVNEDVTILAKYEADGYTVSDWMIDGTKAENFKMPDHDVTITATATPQEFYVYYEVNGQIINGVPYSVDSQVTINDPYEKDGYTVTPWMNGTVEAEDFTMPAHDVYLTATATPINFTVTYWVDGKEVASEEYFTDASVTIREKYQKVGYDVSDWMMDNAKAENFYMPAHDVDITATTTPQMFTVYYEVNGQIINGVPYSVDSQVTINDPYEKTGYTVTPWMNGTEIATDFTMPAHDVYLTATSTPNRYTVTYVVDGEKVAFSDYETDSLVTIKEKYQKTGYEVSDWMFEDNTTATDFTMPPHDVIITATTTPQTFTVYYEVDGVEISKTKVAFNTPVTIEKPYKKEGYTVTPWMNGEKEATDFIMPAEDVHLIATTTPIKFTVTYLVDGIEYAKDTFDTDALVKIIDKYQKAGYEVTDWMIGEEKAVDFTMPAHDVTITATTTPLTFTVYYEVDGIEISSKQYAVDSLVTIADQYVKEGYTVSPWMNGIDEAKDFTMPANDIHLTATTTLNKYRVTYVVDGYKVDYIDYDFGSDVTIKEKYQKAGYEVSDWTIKGEKAENFKMPAQDVIIEATTKPYKYTVTYVVDGEKVGFDQYETDSDVTIREKYQKVGYEVSDWKMDGETAADFTMPPYDVIIEATSTKKTYKVIYKVDGIQIGEAEDHLFETVVKIREKYKLEGYTVSDWTINGEKAEPFTMPAEDVIIEASTQVNSYKVIYMVDKVQVGEPQEVKFGTKVTIKDKYVKEGYVVSDWYTDEANPAVDFTMPAHDVNIYADTTIGTYKVTYKVNGTVFGEVEEYKYGDPVTIRDAYSENGYTASAWMMDGEEAEDFNMLGKDVVITATTTVNSYPVNYYFDGTLYKTENYNYGTTVALLSLPEKNGYEVALWTYDDSTNVPFTFTMPYDEVNIYSKSTPKNYKVIYIFDDEVYEEKEYPCDSIVEILPKPVKEGYTVAPWTFDNGNEPSNFTMPPQDVKIYSKSQINKYTVTYFVDGKQSGNQETHYFKELVQVREKFQKTGYTVTDWDRLGQFEMPAHDVEIHATTSVNSYKVTYFVDGVQQGQVENHNYGENISIRTPFYKEGYTVTEWMFEEDKTTATNFTMSDKDVNIIAFSTINNYKVTYIFDDEIVGEEKYDYNAPVIIREKMVKPGYTVSYWTTEEADPVTDFNMPAHDVVIKAQSTINTHTVTYKVDNQVVGEVEAYDYGEKVTIREKFNKPGYNVSDWSITEEFEMPDEDVVITATTRVIPNTACKENPMQSFVYLQSFVGIACMLTLQVVNKKH